jgi:hypothetical protein
MVPKKIGMNGTQRKKNGFRKKKGLFCCTRGKEEQMEEVSSLVHWV